MTRPKVAILAFVFALFLASITAWLAYRYFQKGLKIVKSVQPQKIVVADSDITVGSTISVAQVKVTTWPKDIVPSGSSQEAKSLIGRVAIRSITRGDAITEKN